MFVLFFYLYRSMFLGSWSMYDLSAMNTMVNNSVTQVGRIVTSIFGDYSHQITDLGTTFQVSDLINLTSYILALITCIGIVWLSVKGIKKVFGVFFMGIR